jgi:CRP-like cAMP-binding protein
VPVTAKLSKLFYERLGEQIANELVDWFNAVDSTYRSDLRDLNETNFARFDAKMEQRFAEFDLKLERRFAASDLKVEQRFAASDLKVEQRFAEVEVSFDKRFGELRLEIRELKADMIKWMFLFWAGTALGGLLLR